jgi:hypothetical protein
VPKFMYEYCCADGHITERLAEPDTRTVLCGQPGCFSEAERIVSAPQIKLEGFTGAFPGAYDRWERVHKEKLAVERRQAASRGE